jgi:hypothetical protein
MCAFTHKTCDNSYILWSRDRDLNPGPLPYHGSALPLSYHGLLWSAKTPKHLALTFIFYKITSINQN